MPGITDIGQKWWNRGLGGHAPTFESGGTGPHPTL